MNNDCINHPQYYNKGKIEAWDFIEDQKLDFFLGNAIKYVTRAGKKSSDTYIQDLRKAIQYLEKKISIIESGDK